MKTLVAVLACVIGLLVGGSRMFVLLRATGISESVGAWKSARLSVGLRRRP